MRQVRTLPAFTEATSPIGNGAASSFTEAAPRTSSVSTTARLVGSDSAWKVRSSSPGIKALVVTARTPRCFVCVPNAERAGGARPIYVS
jgi:hypothetical protein